MKYLLKGIQVFILGLLNSVIPFPYLFFFLVMLGHPYLVGRLIFKTEMPLAIRVGLVIITYPIMFAILWFLIINEPDKSREQKKELAGKDAHQESSRLDYLWIIIVLMPLLLAICFGLMAGQEWQFRHQLRQEGESALGTVQECEKKKNSKGSPSCYISYDYEVPLVDKTTKLYTVREQVDCERACQTGFFVNVSYLPQRPAEGIIEENRYDLKNYVDGFIIFFNFFLVFIIEHLRSLLRSKGQYPYINPE